LNFSSQKFFDADNIAITNLQANNIKAAKTNKHISKPNDFL
jgi:hypothetical protein